MAGIIHHTNCPVCGATDLKFILKAKDHTVTGELFSIYECNSCSLRFTQDAPDAESIGAYYKSENYISHTDSSKGFINRLYQRVRKQTLRNKRRLITRKTGLEKGNILDVGSGTGAFLHEMGSHGWNVAGIEPDEGARAVAKKLYALDLNREIISPSHGRGPGGGFHVITLWHVLEHVHDHDLHSYIQQLKTLLTDDGIIFIAVPNYTSKDAAVYKEHWAAYDVPRHLYHFSPASMKVLLDKNGLKITEYRAMWYDSFYISLLSSQYKTGRANVVSGFWNGLLSNSKALGDTKKCSSVVYIIQK